MKNRTGILCLILGTFLILSSLFLYIYNNTEDNKAGEYSATVLNEVVDVIESNKAEANNHTQDDDKKMSVAVIDSESYIGYIYIPCLEDLELPVISEWSYDRLKKAPCRYQGSVYDGNMVLLGHNYTKHFGKISRLVQGDMIYFTDINGHVYSYSVVGIDVLTDTDTEAITVGDYDLSLFTCDYSGKNRLTVRCIEA